MKHVDGLPAGLLTKEVGRRVQKQVETDFLAAKQHLRDCATKIKNNNMNVDDWQLMTGETILLVLVIRETDEGQDIINIFECNAREKKTQTTPTCGPRRRKPGTVCSIAQRSLLR